MLARTATATLLILALIGVACAKKKQKPATEPRAGQMDPPRQSMDAPPNDMSPKPKPKPKGDAVEVVADIQKRLTRFVPTRIDYDDKLITPDLKPVLKKLIAAAKIMDEIFLIQVDPRNPELRARLAKNPKLADALRYFDVMFGPWDRKHEDQPFVGTRAKPKGAGYYPTDMTKKQFQDHLKANPADKEAFQSYFTVIRRNQAGKLHAIPYNVFYKRYLTRAAKLLDEAAAVAKDKRLKRYLTERAKAFRTNQYRESDKAWMELGDGKIEVVIGPYEVYEDRLFGYKAAFEAFITLRDPKYSDRLAKIVPHIPFLQKSLPMKPEDKKTARGKKVPISVVVQLFTGGDTKAGVQTLAFNLPNDEVVRKEKGYKLVLLKNVAEAKYKKTLLPIAKRIMVTEQLPLVTFDAFFTNTLMHESAHGLGPGMITIKDQAGKAVKTTVNKALRDLYSTIEEAKADIVGLYCTKLLADKGVLPKELGKLAYASYLAGFFRSVRFGVTEAHGRANLIAFNYLIEKGGIAWDTKQKKYRVDYDKVVGKVKELAGVLLEIEARGNYDQTKAFITKYAKVSPEMKAALARLKDIPVDLRPQYAILEKMKTW